MLTGNECYTINMVCVIVDIFLQFSLTMNAWNARRALQLSFSDKHYMWLLQQLQKLSEFRRKNGCIYRENKEKKNEIMSERL